MYRIIIIVAVKLPKLTLYSPMVTSKNKNKTKNNMQIKKTTRNRQNDPKNVYTSKTAKKHNGLNVSTLS